MNPICLLTRRRLGAYQDGELAPRARASVRGHLEGCVGCATTLAELGRMRTLLRTPAPEPPEPVWDAFWPQVRARLAAASPQPEPAPRWRRGWAQVTGHPRLAFGSSVGAVALAVLAVAAPWQRVGERPAVPAPTVLASGSVASAPIEQIVVQSVETGDPQSSVMVFTQPESDFTVVWVFGLERTPI